jgi:hypothetical protein
LLLAKLVRELLLTLVMHYSGAGIVPIMLFISSHSHPLGRKITNGAASYSTSCEWLVFIDFTSD